MFWKKKVPMATYNKFIEAQNDNIKNTVAVIQAQQEELEHLKKYIALLVQVVTPQAPMSFNDMQNDKPVLTEKMIKELLGYGK